MKIFQVLVLVLVVLALFVSPALADSTGNNYLFSGAGLGAGLGAALTIVGAGYGFGKIGVAALESMARQPEVAGRVQTAMIVIAALLEGVTLFALVVCFQLISKASF
jgi:F-type H+-transporting ATPase subunit c